MKSNFLKSLSRFPENLYYIAFASYVLFMGIGHTMFSYDNNYTSILMYLKLLCTALVFLKVIFSNKTNPRRAILICVTFAVLIIVFFSMNSTIPIFLMILFFGAENCDARIMAKIYLYLTGTLYTITFIASQVGIIEDRVLLRGGNSTVLRHSFGTKYVTVFGAICFFCVAVYLYLKKDKITLKHLVIIGVLTIFVNRFTDTRLEAVSIIFLLVCVYCFKYIRSNSLLRKCLAYSIPICYITAFGLVFLYMTNNSAFSFLDELLSDRLSLGQKGILEYGFSLFGKVIPMQGYGTIDFDWSKGYFYLDSFFINYTLQYGLAFVLLFLYFTHTTAKGLAKLGDWWTLLFVFFTAFHGIIISSVFDLEMSPFLYIAYAAYTNSRKTQKIVLIDYAKELTKKKRRIIKWR